MTLALAGSEAAARLDKSLAAGIAGLNPDSLLVKSEFLFDIAAFLKDEPGLNFNYLVHITAIDYCDYFELVYHLVSLKHNHSLVIKTRCTDRKTPTIPSVVSLWRGAELQEREIFDLMGINFEGHPNMKRIFLWEGFQGHPLRKDFTDGS
ncbi:MAG TPA: NADH-quinone oxidoreductase subunit C [Dehalococcoidia bacterium]|nr:NADH-quinone oxidoreductase subunit C [Dehalococcoidia bacterium]